MRLLRSDEKDGTCANTDQSTIMNSVNCMEKLHCVNISISISKLYSVVGSFFGSMKEVPFTKSLLKTLCGKLNREQLENDAAKTIEVFNAMSAEDPEFKYSVQVERMVESRL